MIHEVVTSKGKSKKTKIELDTGIDHERVENFNEEQNRIIRSLKKLLVSILAYISPCTFPLTLF